MVNVRVCAVCLASGNEHDIPQGVCVREHEVHERFLCVREYDDYLCDCANVYEPPLDANAGVNAFQCL
jgi:hypothetical protein